jgi:hypothetical protein
MNLNQFKKQYRCTFEINPISTHECVAISKAIRRDTGAVVASIKNTIDIMEVGQWIADSQQMDSVTPWNWQMYIDRLQRAQLDWFALRASIDDFYPNDLKVDITELYS